MCSLFYSIHTNSLLLKETEENHNKMLDCNYFKIDINAIVAGVGIDDNNKKNLQITIRKFKRDYSVKTWVNLLIENPFILI